MSDGAGTGQAGTSGEGQSVSTQGGEGQVNSQATGGSEISAEGATDVTKESQTKEQQTKDDIHDLFKYVREKNPDRKFEKDTDYYDHLYERIQDSDKTLDRYKEGNKIVNDIFESNPQTLEFMQYLRDGMDESEAMVRAFDMDALIESWQNIDNEPDENALKKARKEKMSKLEAKRKQDQEYSKNLEVSKKNLLEFAKENNFDEAKNKEFLAQIDGIFDSVNKGIVSKEFLVMMQKALNYETDIANETKAAEIKGRNEVIDEKKAEPVKKGDGVPKIQSARDVNETKEQKLDVLSRDIDELNKQRANFFSRGVNK